MIYIFLVVSFLAALASGLFAGWQGTELFRALGVFFGVLVGLILLFVLLLALVSLFVSRKEPEKRSPFVHFVTVWGIGLITQVMLTFIKVEGAEKIPADGRWLFVGNHRSSFDPLLTVWALRKHELAFVAKPPVFRIPLIGPIIYRDFYLPIDREDNREALKTILKAAEYIKTDKTSMGIYPEGRRSADATLLPFRNGALKIAQRAKVPIVLGAIEGTERTFHRFPLSPVRAKLTILTVIPAEEVAAHSTAELGDRCRELLLAKLGK